MVASNDGFAKGAGAGVRKQKASACGTSGTFAICGRSLLRILRVGDQALSTPDLKLSHSCPLFASKFSFLRGIAWGTLRSAWRASEASPTAA